MIKNNHYASSEINFRRQTVNYNDFFILSIHNTQVLEQHKELLSLATKRHDRLQDCYLLQQFLHDGEEIRTWIADKIKTASDETYKVTQTLFKILGLYKLKDPTNLEGKIQQHQTFEAELQANRHRLDSVVSTGRDLISRDHFATDQIRYILLVTYITNLLYYFSNVCQELEDLWSELEILSTDKGGCVLTYSWLEISFYAGEKLQQAHNQQQFDRAVKDVELWLEEVDKQLNTDELGKVSNLY